MDRKLGKQPHPCQSIRPFLRGLRLMCDRSCHPRCITQRFSTRTRQSEQRQAHIVVAASSDSPEVTRNVCREINVSIRVRVCIYVIYVNNQPYPHFCHSCRSRNNVELPTGPRHRTKNHDHVCMCARSSVQ